MSTAGQIETDDKMFYWKGYIRFRELSYASKLGSNSGRKKKEKKKTGFVKKNKENQGT